MTITIDTSRVELLVREHAMLRMQGLADTFVERAQQNASRRTGEMADSISHDLPEDRGERITCTATCTAEYAQYQEEGTGIYGPEGVPITPRSSPVLVFDWPAAGGIVFARSVQGSEPTHFWSRTIEDWPLIVSASS